MATKEIKKLKFEIYSLRRSLEISRKALDRLAASQKVVGATPIINVSEVESVADMVSITRISKRNHRSSAKVFSLLKQEGILEKKGKMWVFTKEYEQKGLGQYIRGHNGRVGTLVLMLTPLGVEFMQEFIDNHPSRRSKKRIE